MEKNQTNKWVVFAYGLPDHASPGQPIAGDAANITANIRIDGAAANAVDDVNPTELEDGYYIFDITATESNGDQLLLAPASATANVQVIAVPGSVWTRPPNFNALGVETDGDLTKCNLVATTTANTDMRGTDSALLAASINLTGGAVDTVTTLTNKTGFSLAATGLDAIASTATGMIEIAKAIWDRVLSGATHNIATSAGRRLRGIQEFQGYEGGAVWLDTVNGTAGTVSWENGTVEAPVDTLADAVTIAANLNMKRFELSNDSSITFAESHTSEVWLGNGWALALGGQDISQSHFNHCNDVSGVGTSGTGECHIVDSHIANSLACTLGQAHLSRCSIGAGGLVLSQASDYTIDDCSSGIAGPTTPSIDMGAAVGATNLSVRKWSGGLTLDNLATGDVVTLEGTFGTITLNGADATVEIRGIYKEIVNNLTGSPSVNFDGGLNPEQLIDDNWDEVLSGGTHNVSDSSGKRIRDLQEFGSYEGGAVFIDTINGAAGTTDYESGTILNPVDAIADANTLAASLGLSRFEVAPASSITFAAGQIGQVFNGIGWSLALGGQDISNSEVRGAQSVTGVATTATGEAHFFDCELVTGTLGQSHLKFCGLSGTLTLSAAANYTASDCYSQIPGSPTPIIDFGAAVGNTGLSMRRYSGGIEIQNYGTTGTDTMSLEGDGQLVINANCAGGTIYVRGNFKVTDNSGGAVTIVYDDNTANLAALNDISAGDILTTQLTEAYAADGVAPTLSQAIFLIQQMVGDFAISGTTITTKKLDGSTTAATHTLDDGTNPTSRTRTT